MTNLLIRWVAFVTRSARICLALILALTIGLGWVAVTQFRVNSDLGQLIDQTSDWRVDFDNFQAQFPDLVKTAVIVVSSTSIGEVEEVTEDIVAYLNARSDRFSAIAAPGSEPFFRDHAFLYLDPDQFDQMIDRLAEAQPLIARVAETPDLSTAFQLLHDAYRNETDAPFDLLTEHLVASGQAVLNGERGKVRWADVFFQNESTRYQLIFVKPSSSFDVTLPDAEVMAELRAMRDGLTLPGNTRVQFTGEIPLQHEEIEAAIEGVTLAGWLALALLFLVLLVGVRSGKIIAATFSMLAIGILWTSAYAMLTVGEYNTLSLIFVVMFFGLGVDFALHFSLRLQEETSRGDYLMQAALAASTRSVGGAIALCSLTTAVGFLGFWPTAYQGLADLGVISAGGMFIACFLTFTYLPAFYQVFGQPRSFQMELPTSDKAVRWLLQRRRMVIITLAVGGGLAAYGASRASFDYSVLAIKDAQSESMLALRELQREGLSTDYQLSVIGDGPVDKARLEALRVVGEVVLPEDRVPVDQADKLAAMEDVQFMFWDFLSAELKAPQGDLHRARASAAALLQELPQDGALRALLGEFSTAPDSQWRAWEAAVLDDLVREMAWLQRALVVEQISFDDLPGSVRSRLITASGQHLSVILPEDNIADVDALSAFITETRQVYANATGRPVLEWGVGQIVLGAFQEALLFAVVGIGFILLLALKQVRTALLVLGPLALAALCSFAVIVLIDIPLNMANILVLPLIFGLGVDNGIHVVERYLGEGDVDQLMQSSTPRAVVLSTLTTIGAFAALSISPHMGTASIGVLLTVAISFLLVFTVFLLPVLLEVSGLRQRSASVGQ